MDKRLIMTDGSKKPYIIIFLLFGIFIGWMAFFLLETTEQAGVTELSKEEIVARDDLLKGYLDEQAYLQSRIVSLRESLTEEQKKIKTHSESANLQILDNLKKSIGLSEISGKGIEILLNDSPSVFRDGLKVDNEDLVQAADLRDIVNLLNAAKVDGLSINNQRIISTSPISSVGTAILVNNSYITPPFYIHAVGDIDSMLQRLLIEKNLASLYERKKKSNVIFEIAAKNRLTIPVYNGNLKADLLNLVKGI
ncbi:MAG: DUF881 domain-containing protein [Candidatus Gracilibacteria bacterium]